MDQTAVRVSIIIPCHNAENYLRTAIDSALNQSYREIEVIVIDDGSKDGSGQILKNYGMAVTTQYQDCRGAGAARNTGLKLASGHYIKFLDADDFLLPECIEHEVEEALVTPKESFVVGRAYNLNQVTGVIRAHAHRDRLESRNETILETIIDTPTLSAPLYPRALIDALGGFNGSLSVREDFELFVRALLLGFKPRFIHSPSFVYRQHGGVSRVSQQISIKRVDDEVKIYQILSELHHGLADIPLQAATSAGLAASAWITARNCLRWGFERQALDIFNMARSFGGRNYALGGGLYRAFVYVLGPIRAEHIVSVLKRDGR